MNYDIVTVGGLLRIKTVDFTTKLEQTAKSRNTLNRACAGLVIDIHISRIAVTLRNVILVRVRLRASAHIRIASRILTGVFYNICILTHYAHPFISI